MCRVEGAPPQWVSERMRGISESAPVLNCAPRIANVCTALKDSTGLGWIPNGISLGSPGKRSPNLVSGYLSGTEPVRFTEYFLYAGSIVESATVLNRTPRFKIIHLGASVFSCFFISLKGPREATQIFGKRLIWIKPWHHLGHAAARCLFLLFLHYSQA